MFLIDYEVAFVTQDILDLSSLINLLFFLSEENFPNHLVKEGKPIFSHVI
jgi:hypothetical protein